MKIVRTFTTIRLKDSKRKLSLQRAIKKKKEATNRHKGTLVVFVLLWSPESLGKIGQHFEIPVSRDEIRGQMIEGWIDAWDKAVASPVPLLDLNLIIAELEDARGAREF